LHLLFLFFFNSLSSIKLFPNEIDELLSENPEKEQRLEFELVETPEDARSDVAPENADLVSDKNAFARDGYSQKDKTEGNPFSEGDLDVKNLPTINLESDPAKSAEPKPESPSENKQEQNNDAEPEFAYEKFSRQHLLKEAQPQPQVRQDNLNRPLYENREFNAKDLGGFSFNTYNWNFAPYMLAMKRKVENNIFPPPAFTHMGLIGGDTILRFKVMPNGEVKELRVLRFSGHPSLKETSVQAILNSSRFKPLPSDFPEDFLEVTASFSYYVSRRK
jgi:hypothetical protein